MKLMGFGCVAAMLLLGGADAHGRMERLRAGGKTVPTRKGPGYEDDPVNSNLSKFRCQNARKAPAITITAGGTMDIEWGFGAAHLGDCALYLSYSTGGNADLKFFKIANFPECNLDNKNFVTVNLPKWLPDGVAVVRWDWYALHTFPGAELYAQCTDIEVTGSDGTVTIAKLNELSYDVMGIYPTRSGTGNKKYRNPRGNNRPKFFMTGPDCIGGITGNCCDVANYQYGAAYTSCQNTGTSLGESPAAGQVVGGGGAPPAGGALTPAPTPASNPCVLHNVVEGETLTSIAADYSAKQCAVSAQDIRAFNMIQGNMNADPGETYTIPCPGNCCTDNSCVAGQASGLNNKFLDPVAQATKDANDSAKSYEIAVGLLSTVVVALLAVIVRGRRLGTLAPSWMGSGAAASPAAPPAPSSAASGAAVPPPLPPKNAQPAGFSKHPEVGGESAINLKVEANSV